MNSAINNKADNSDLTALQGVVDGKMDEMTVDSAPTSGSANLVTSGGVYTAINNKQDKLPTGTEGQVWTAGSDGTGKWTTPVNEVGAVGYSYAGLYNYTGSVTIQGDENKTSTRSLPASSGCSSSNISTSEIPHSLIYSQTLNKIHRVKFSTVIPAEVSTGTGTSDDTRHYYSVKNYGLTGSINQWLQTLVGKKIIEYGGEYANAVMPNAMRISFGSTYITGATSIGFTNDPSYSTSKLYIAFGINSNFDIPITLDSNGCIESISSFNPSDVYLFASGSIDNTQRFWWKTSSISITATPVGSVSLGISGITIITL